MPKTRRNAEADDVRGVFIVPDDGKYFCLCHLRFWKREATVKAHMQGADAKKGACAEAVQCASCFRWFPSKIHLTEHQKKVGTHTLPDETDYIGIGADITNEQGEAELQVKSTRVLCVNMQGYSLNDCEAKIADLCTK